jgi:hypothetical protein
VTTQLVIRDGDGKLLCRFMLLCDIEYWRPW